MPDCTSTGKPWSPARLSLRSGLAVATHTPLQQPPCPERGTASSKADLLPRRLAYHMRLLTGPFPGLSGLIFCEMRSCSPGPPLAGFTPSGTVHAPRCSVRPLAPPSSHSNLVSTPHYISLASSLPNQRTSATSRALSIWCWGLLGERPASWVLVKSRSPPFPAPLNRCCLSPPMTPHVVFPTQASLFGSWF